MISLMSHEHTRGPLQLQANHVAPAALSVQKRPAWLQALAARCSLLAARYTRRETQRIGARRVGALPRPLGTPGRWRRSSSPAIITHRTACIPRTGERSKSRRDVLQQAPPSVSHQTSPTKLSASTLRAYADGFALWLERFPFSALSALMVWPSRPDLPSQGCEACLLRPW